MKQTCSTCGSVDPDVFMPGCALILGNRKHDPFHDPIHRKDPRAASVEAARLALARSVGCCVDTEDVEAVIASLRRDGWTVQPPYRAGVEV